MTKINFNNEEVNVVPKVYSSADKAREAGADVWLKTWPDAGEPEAPMWTDGTRVWEAAKICWPDGTKSEVDPAYWGYGCGADGLFGYDEKLCAPRDALAVMMGRGPDKDLKEVLEKHAKWLANEPDGERADLSHADLHGVNLRGANLSGANLSEADLNGANLSGASLSGAVLRDADLRNANLAGADLNGANLDHTDLSGANLVDAALRNVNLAGADLTGARLQGADLRGACWPLEAGWSDVTADKRLACQLLRTALLVMKGVDDQEVQEVCALPQVVALADQFQYQK